MKSLILVSLFFAPMAFAKSNVTVKCVFDLVLNGKQIGGKTSFEVNESTSSVTTIVVDGNRTFTDVIANNPTDDLIGYTNRIAENLPANANGYLFAVNRKPQKDGALRLEAVEGMIQSGKLAGSTYANWSLGMADGSVVTTSKQTLLGLSCAAEKK